MKISKSGEWCTHVCEAGLHHHQLTPLIARHFHVYFFQNNDQSVADAMRLKAEIVENVRQGKFLAVCDGVDANVTKAGFGLDFDSTLVPEVNMGPRGPHPAGSYEVWVPVEHVGALISYLTLHRGEVSLLFHPLTKHCIEDHTGRIMFMGPSFNIDRTVLDENDDECDGSQYPELGLGYSRR